MGVRISRSGLSIGPVYIRLSRRNLANWGFEAICVGGYSFWSRTSDGGRMLAAYHPHWSTTWIWSVTLRKRRDGEPGLFSRKAIDIDRKLHADGNPYVAPVTWRRRFMRLTVQHQGQWHDDYRLPFGRYLIVSRQDYHLRQRAAEERTAKLRRMFMGEQHDH